MFERARAPLLRCVNDTRKSVITPSVLHKTPASSAALNLSFAAKRIVDTVLHTDNTVVYNMNGISSLC